MGLRRPGVAKDYEEMPGANVAPLGKSYHNHHHLHQNASPRTHLHQNSDIGSHPMGHDLEMSSVSVVPDGLYFIIAGWCLAGCADVNATHTTPSLQIPTQLRRQ